MLKRRRRQFFLHGEDGDRAGWISVNGCTECRLSIKGSSFLIHSQPTTRNLNSSLLSLSSKSVQVTKHEFSHLPQIAMSIPSTEGRIRQTSCANDDAFQKPATFLSPFRPSYPSRLPIPSVNNNGRYVPGRGCCAPICTCVLRARLRRADCHLPESRLE